MQAALVFAASAGLAYYNLRDTYQSQLQSGPDLQGLNIYRPMVTLGDPTYTPSPDKINISYREDLTPSLASRQQALITASRIESRHPILDSLRFQDQPNMGPLQTTELPNASYWTHPGHLYGV